MSSDTFVKEKHLKDVIEIVMTVIVLVRRSAWVGLPETRSNKHDKQSHWVKPEFELFLERAVKKKNLCYLYDYTFRPPRPQRVSRLTFSSPAEGYTNNKICLLLESDKNIFSKPQTFD